MQNAQTIYIPFVDQVKPLKQNETTKKMIESERVIALVQLG